MTALDIDTLVVVRDQSARLIRAEVRSAEQRAMLEDAVRDAVLKLGIAVDEVSEASGLTPDEIRSIMSAFSSVSNDLALDTLAGTRV